MKKHLGCMSTMNRQTREGQVTTVQAKVLQCRYYCLADIVVFQTLSFSTIGTNWICAMVESQAASMTPNNATNMNISFTLMLPTLNNKIILQVKKKTCTRQLVSSTNQLPKQHGAHPKDWTPTLAFTQGIPLTTSK